ncbi:DUF4158 domain-containing protein [Patulibacter sp. NPDC049589]|uniref:DUF4158 domain-containing protein n=1 Tax=Patulibacter sp. NPDC049589 TaxID=3154731 RepID=UPI00342578F0
MDDDAGAFDGLVAAWTLVGEERDLVEAKYGDGRLGFALQLKGFLAWGHFARQTEEFSSEAVAFVAGQIDAAPRDLVGYDWSGRTGRRHRAEIRAFLGFRECTVEDADRLCAWLARDVCRAERDPARVHAELASEFVVQRIEPPSEGRLDRIVRSALRRGEAHLCERVVSRLGPTASARLEELLGNDGDDIAVALAEIRGAPGAVSLNTLLAEIRRLRAARAIGLPEALFVDIAPAVVKRWCAQASVESPSHLRRHRQELGLTLLASLIHVREREITDTLIDLLISTVHRIGARADRRGGWSGSWRWSSSAAAAAEEFLCDLAPAVLSRSAVHGVPEAAVVRGGR